MFCFKGIYIKYINIFEREITVINCGRIEYKTTVFFTRSIYPRSQAHLVSGDRGMYRKRPAGWWMGPPKRRANGERYAASGGTALLLLDGLLANLTVMGSVAPSGIEPFNFCIARSASTR